MQFSFAHFLSQYGYLLSYINWGLKAKVFLELDKGARLIVRKLMSSSCIIIN